MYPQVTQIETRERLAREQLEQLRIRHAGTIVARPTHFRPQLRRRLLHRLRTAS